MNEKEPYNSPPNRIEINRDVIRDTEPSKEIISAAELGALALTLAQFDALIAERDSYRAALEKIVSFCDEDLTAQNIARQTLMPRDGISKLKFNDTRKYPHHRDNETMNAPIVHLSPTPEADQKTIKTNKKGFFRRKR
ncbi:MAG: hypothetical protein NVSMB46_01710 [Candidatus Saccharimonadales bacterium]